MRGGNNHAAQDFDDYVQAFATIAAAAAAENLQVISPTVRKGTGEGQEAWWLAQFLGACNEDSTYSCDEDAIALFDLVCALTRVRITLCSARAAQLQLQGVQVGHGQQQLPRADEGRPKDGAGGARGGGAHGPHGVGMGDVGRLSRHLGHGNLVRFNWEPPDNVGSCERNAEKHDAAWGTGSVIALDNSPMVSRWAW